MLDPFEKNFTIILYINIVTFAMFEEVNDDVGNHTDPESKTSEGQRIRKEICIAFGSFPNWTTGIKRTMMTRSRIVLVLLFPTDSCVSSFTAAIAVKMTGKKDCSSL